MDKYDRQLRLWGSKGQNKLSDSHVLVTNSNSLGSECLKNLVLAGIGRYTLIDNISITMIDSNSNYLTPPSTINQQRGQVVKDKLFYINRDVKGLWVKEYVPNDDDYDLILVVEEDQTVQQSWVERGRAMNVPVMLIYSIGLLGYLRISCQSLQVHSAIKQNSVMHHDLRLLDGFTQLDQYVNTFQIDTIAHHHLLHIPYIVILRKVLHIYKLQNNGNLPKTFTEKEQFKKLIIESSRDSYKDNVSFQEAHDNSWKVFKPASELNDNLQNIFNIIENDKQKVDVKDRFWQICLALKLFYEENNALPIQGSIPDMNSSTNFYLNLQKAYKDKFKEDKQKLKEKLEIIQQQFGLPKNNQIFSDSEISDWIKNCQDLQFLEYKQLEDELNDTKIEEYQENDNYKWYLVLRGCMQFESIYKRRPLKSDQQCLKSLINKIIEENVDNKRPVEDKYIHEVCRYEGQQIHTTVALMAGVVAQEAIKIITSQNTPIQHTLVYDGVQTTMAVHRF